MRVYLKDNDFYNIVTKTETSYMPDTISFTINTKDYITISDIEPVLVIEIKQLKTLDDEQ